MRPHRSTRFPTPRSGPRSTRPEAPGLGPVVVLVALFVLPGRPGHALAQADRGDPAAQAEVAAVLDGLHRAAAEADFDAYFGLYAREAVFLGTDATERWTRAEFEAYARPYFEAGRGWSYEPVERHVRIAEGGETAWFDERLRNASLGETRGSGVLVREDGAWKVAHYNLTIPVPNEIAAEVVERIREVTGGGRR